MTEIKTEIPNNSIKYFKRNIILPISISLALMLCLALTLQAFFTPLKSIKKETINILKQKGEFTCAADAKPSTLYPQGGNIEDRKIFLTNIINNLNVKINVLFEADKPLTVQGKKKVLLLLRAGDLWEHEFPGIPQEEFKFVNQKSINIINENYVLDLFSIFNFIGQVEKETKVVPSEYVLVIKPIVEASAPEEKKDLTYSTEYPIKISLSNIETGEVEVEDKEVKFESIKEIKNSFKVFGFKLPLTYARYIFLGLSIVLLIVAVTLWLSYLKTNTNDKNAFEYEVINRKYRNRIVFASAKSVINDKDVQIKMKSFKELLKLADEQEKEIICIPKNGDLNRVIYYVVEGNSLYLYEPDVVLQSAW